MIAVNPKGELQQPTKTQRSDKVSGEELNNTRGLLLEHVKLRDQGNRLQIHGISPRHVTHKVTIEVGVNKDGKDQDRYSKVNSAVSGGNVHFSKSVLIGLVGLLKRSHASPASTGGEDEGQDFNYVVKPIAGLVVGEVSLVPDNRSEAEEEDEAVQLQRLNGNTSCALAHKGLDVENAKSKHSRHGTVGHEEREVPTRQDEVNKQGRCEETCPYHNVLIESLKCYALLSPLSLVGLAISTGSLVWLVGYESIKNNGTLVI